MTGGAILLAAGFSRRFGSDKRRHLLPDGRTLLEASASLYASAFSRLLIVLRPEDRDLAEAFTASGEEVRIVYCRDAAEGMGRSLAAGARAAQAQGWQYLFVALADMPWVRQETLTLLRGEMEAAETNAIIVPVWDGRPGHPVGFGAVYISQLAALSGDAGARQIVARAGEAVRRLTVADPGVLQDLDTAPSP